MIKHVSIGMITFAVSYGIFSLCIYHLNYRTPMVDLNKTEHRLYTLYDTVDHSLETQRAKEIEMKHWVVNHLTTSNGKKKRMVAMIDKDNVQILPKQNRVTNVKKNNVRKFKINEKPVKQLIKLIKESTDSKINLYIQQAHESYISRDYKNSLKNYNLALQLDPKNNVAFEESEKLKELLERKARKLYSEAIVFMAIPDYKVAKQKLDTIIKIIPESMDYFKKAEQMLEEIE